MIFPYSKELVSQIHNDSVGNLCFPIIRDTEYMTLINASIDVINVDYTKDSLVYIGG